MDDPSIFQDVIAAARAAIEAKRAAAHERAEPLRVALQSYVMAAEGEIAAAFAGTNGLAWTAPPARPLAAALSLRSLVEALPELRGQPAAATESASRAAPPSSPAQANSNASPAGAAPRTGSAPRPSEASGSEGAELMKIVKGLELDKMPEPLFRVWADELAAKARAIQDWRGEEEIPTQIIRRLTAMTKERGITGIFGLSRQHTANWYEVAAEAEKTRCAFETSGQAPRKDPPKSER